MPRTDYLAAAICNALNATGGVTVEELEVELPAFYDGTATTDEIKRELTALVSVGSVETTYDPDYGVIFTDAD